MTTISIQEAQAHLRELIAGMQPGEELLITQQDQPVARLVAESAKQRRPRKPGSAIGRLEIVEDDEAHLDDFSEYMPRIVR